MILNKPSWNDFSCQFHLIVRKWADKVRILSLRAEVEALSTAMLSIDSKP